MQVFAPTPFRYSGVDYPYGYQSLDQALADTLIAAGLVRATTPSAAGGGSASFGSLTGAPTDNASLGSALSARVAASSVGAANGVAGLDGTGKVPTAQLPASIQGALNYQGAWNASTNSPALTSGSGTKGFYYTVSVAGTTTLDGTSSWSAGDHVAFNGATWEKFDGIASEVLTVAGKTGAVTLVPSDISGMGVPTSQTTGHTFSNSDNGEHIIASGTPAYVLNSGLANGWGVSIKGAFTLSGTATVTDLRTTTGTAMCSLVQTDTAGTGLTYDLVGTK
jgi:hypothetical protein